MSKSPVNTLSVKPQSSLTLTGHVEVSSLLLLSNTLSVKPQSSLTLTGHVEEHGRSSLLLLSNTLSVKPQSSLTLTGHVEEHGCVGGAQGGALQDGVEVILVALQQAGREAQERLLDL